MYIPSKRVIAFGLVTGLVFSTAGSFGTVNAGQEYDSSNVGIANKVGEYILLKQTESTDKDPIAELTAGMVSKKDLEEKKETEKKEETVVSESTETDAEEVKASPTDAKIYTQFQDRAVITAGSKVNIRSGPSTDDEVIGAIDRGGICLVKEIGDEWTKIASGTCEGYVYNGYLAYGDDAGEWCLNNDIPRTATVNTVTLKVREEKSEDSLCVTLLPEGENYYVYSEGDEWTEISVDDDIRGFVKSDYVEVKFNNPRAVSVEEQKEADRKAEEERRKRQEELDRQWLEYLASKNGGNNNTASNDGSGNSNSGSSSSSDSGHNEYSDSSSSSSSSSSSEPSYSEPKKVAAPAGQTGVDLANYAVQFVGNPYVWGGTSLTNGADCSGFVLSIYAQFGYSLPHNAAMQAGYGTEVSMSDLQCGDLLFYSNGGGIGHVAIYIGGGMVVHAASSRDGIKTSVYNYRTPVKATRLLGQ